jgi:hypothetical protein
MKNNNKILGIVSAAALVVLVLLVPTTTTTTIAYAQPGVTSPEMTSPPPATSSSTTTTANVSSVAQQIINTAQAECANAIQLGPELQGSTEDLGFDFQAALADFCAFIVYESANTVVLGGDLLINTSPGLYSDNPFLWQAVDGFKAQGYTTIESVLPTGQGTEANPHKLYIVMSK